MKNLYIIGNGFDKHHGIPSGYWDFHEWLLKKDKKLVEEIDELYCYDQDLWGNFEVELGNLDVVEKAQEIYSDHPANLLSDHYDREYHEGQIVAGDTIGGIYNQIRASFPEWIRSLDKGDSKRLLKLEDDSFFITFNYTDTLIDLYKIPEKDILFIHGRSALDGDHLVLGHGKSEEQVKEESEKGIDENTEMPYVETVWAIERQVNMMRKQTEKIIVDNQNVWDSLTDIEHIYVYGCSLSEVDLPYFKTIVSKIDATKVKWEVNAFGKDIDDYNKDCSYKMKFLEELGINKDLITTYRLVDILKYQAESLFANKEVDVRFQ